MTGPDGPAPTLHVLWCDACGRGGIVRHRDLGDIRLAHALFLEQQRGIPNAQIFGWGDAYDGPALDRAGYVAAVEARARACACGGAFRFAPDHTMEEPA